jgi:UDP-glucose 4-epimerase
VRAVVTGGAGFIGSHLVDRLAADGWDVLVVDDFSTGDHVHEHPRVEVQRCAIVEAPMPRGVDAVFHLASPVGPVGVLRQAGRIVPKVVDDAETVALWARLNRCPLVDVSTSELYGPQGGACSEGLPRVTPAGHSARMEYAVAKLAAETMLLNTAGLDVRIVRPFNVAGPRQKPDGGFVVPRFVRQALAGEPLTVYTPGTQVRAFTHVADIVEGLMRVLRFGRPGDLFNLGNPRNLTTPMELAQLVLDACGEGGRIEVVDPQSLWGPAFREAADKWPDASLAAVRLGWEAELPLGRIVADVVAERRGTAVAA